MQQEKLVGYIRTATHDVFETMLGLKLTDSAAAVQSASPTSSGEVMALVGLAGAWAGTGTFSCPADLARHISGSFLMQEFPAVDEEVLDAIGEIANMVLGNVKTSLEEELGPMGLSIPTVIFGRNFTTRSVTKSEWTQVPFDLEGGRITVHLCLAPGRQTPVPQPAGALALPL
jgi:chemotaxis protein CheX